MIDAASGGALMTKTVAEASALFKTLATHSQQWRVERGPSKDVGVHEIDVMSTMATQISNLNKKFDNLMTVKFVKSFDVVCDICAGWRFHPNLQWNNNLNVMNPPARLPPMNFQPQENKTSVEDLIAQLATNTNNFIQAT
ncbi:hypothetical protein TB2_045614 [Malus domestica]